MNIIHWHTSVFILDQSREGGRLASCAFMADALVPWRGVAVSGGCSGAVSFAPNTRESTRAAPVNRWRRLWRDALSSVLAFALPQHVMSSVKKLLKEYEMNSEITNGQTSAFDN